MIAAATLLLVLTQAPATEPTPRPLPNGPVVVLTTSLGQIKIGLHKDKAPITVDNFLKYVHSGHFDGTIFHRVMPGFMIQGGGLSPDMTERPTGPPIKNEARNGLRNSRGTVAMARTHAARSATSQFFINLVDNPGLDHHGFAPDDFGYAVFGRVIDGWDTVEKIAASRTKSTPEGMDNVPETPIVIKSVTLKGRE